MTELNDMLAQNLAAAQTSADFIAKTGGLPETTRASADLRTAIDQTREEITRAVFASRFPTSLSDYFNTMTANGSGLSAITRLATQEEGEAGLKRATLLSELNSIEGALFGLITRIVELRTDLIVSQQEF